MSLLGSLVEVFGLDDVLDPTPRMLEINPAMEPLFVNGLKGWASEWIEDEARYQVETFDGDFICIRETNLRQYIPPAASNGGFDAAWPVGGLAEDFESFASLVAGTCMEKHYCCIQMTGVRDQAQAALLGALMCNEWSRILPEFETSFLGNCPNAKINWLPSKPSTNDDGTPQDALSAVDGMLTAVTTMLSPFSEYFGFVFGSRSAGLLRMPFEDEAEETSLKRGVGGDRVTGREIEGHMSFTNRRRIGLIYFLHGSGTITLTYDDGAKPPVELSAEQGRLLIFRHDHMSYSYKPTGKRNLALQAWVFREDEPDELDMLARTSHNQILETWDKSLIPIPPSYGNSDKTVDIMSATCRVPGGTCSVEDFWMLLETGADGIEVVPTTRWDESVYYDADTKSPGEDNKMYVRHFGFLDHDAMLCFDNEFWNMTPEECKQKDPAARVALEVAYETLARSGWTRKTLQNTSMAWFCGLMSNAWFEMYFQGDIWDIKRETSVVCQGVSYGAAYDYIPYVLGFKGPAHYVDTACSSSLTATALMHSHIRPRMPGQIKGNHHSEVTSGLVMGCMTFFEPGAIIGMCGAGMLTHQGRCFTFDSSADGFCRSEGIDGMHFQQHKTEHLSKLAVLAGSGMNSDGKSASLTAPNGPSQTALTRQVMREASVTAFEVQTQELHGTGTPLGDPIEVGALKAAMERNEQGKTRTLPIIKTSSKSAIAHTEYNAGITGLMKCVLMLMGSSAIPGLHLRLLNPNMDSGGYPVIFNNELLDTMKSTDNCGVSSFGVGGSNARADVWGQATSGPRKVLPVGMDFTVARHEAFGETEYTFAGRAGTLMDTSGQPEVFDDVFINGTIEDTTTLSLSGTWSRYSTMDPLEKVPEMSFGDVIMYQSAFILGETLVEEFRIHVDNYSDSLIFPASASAGQDAIVLGPGNGPQGHHWRVDGREDGAQKGAIYVVTFVWHPRTQEKKVTWELMEEDIELPFEMKEYSHLYSIKGSFTSWLWRDMLRVGDGVFQTEITIGNGNRGKEEFHFSRDSDENQLIYPAAGMDDKSMLLTGPDRNGRGKHWSVQGDEGDVVTLRLTVKDGLIRLSIKNDQGGPDQKWENQSTLALDG